MRHCTHTPNGLPLIVAVALAVLVSASGLLAASARADGDPASDVLATQSLFLYQDAGVPANEQAQIGALLQEARREGYEIRVAVIASPTDLGSVTALWRQPQSYVRFLGQELSFLYRGPLLVVMPDGYGVYRLTGEVAPDQSALAGLRSPGSNLGTATLTAIQRLAAAHGHSLPIPHATAPSTPRSSDTVSWIVFAIGVALTVIAWTASLRARPLRGVGRKQARRDDPVALPEGHQGRRS